MAKKIASVIKLNIPAGKGTPAPPVGPALGQAGINMMEFLKKFNEMSMQQMGYTLPVEIVVYEDRSYSFVVKQPLVSDLIKQAIGIEKGSQTPGKEVVASISRAKLLEVAKKKMADFNTSDEEMAMRVVAGTARSMGIKVEG
jgi:large subunit ribosomal protein L11